MTNFLAFYPHIPESTNKLYYNRPGGGRGISAKADAYKKRLISWLVQEFIHSGCKGFDPNAMYDVRLLFMLPNLFTKGWPKKADTRFKKEDVDNLVKLLLDGLSAAMGIDDRCFFSVMSTKVPSEISGVGIHLMQIEEVARDGTHIDIMETLTRQFITPIVHPNAALLNAFLEMVEETTRGE